MWTCLLYKQAARCISTRKHTAKLHFFFFSTKRVYFILFYFVNNESKECEAKYNSLCDVYMCLIEIATEFIENEIEIESAYGNAIKSHHRRRQRDKGIDLFICVEFPFPNWQFLLC